MDVTTASFIVELFEIIWTVTVEITNRLHKSPRLDWLLKLFWRNTWFDKTLTKEKFEKKCLFSKSFFFSIKILKEFGQNFYQKKLFQTSPDISGWKNILCGAKDFVRLLQFNLTFFLLPNKVLQSIKGIHSLRDFRF